MAEKLRATVESEGDTSVVKLVGFLDEENKLKRLVEKIPAGTAMIDLAGVERINSLGIRDWVNWMAALEANGTRPVLVSCSPAIVAQINLVNNFTGSGVVKSFYVPYFCPECDEEKVLLVEASDMGPPPHEPPTCRCDECDLVMDFDDMPDSYFAFLSNQRKLAEPDKINGAMRDLGQGGEKKVRNRASQPNLSSGSKPSVPSLPSIQRTSTQPMKAPSSGQLLKPPSGQLGKMKPPSSGQLLKPSSRPPLGQKPPSSPQLGMSSGAHISMRMPMGAPGLAAPPARSNALVIMLVGILVAAIIVLAYLVLTK